MQALFALFFAAGVGAWIYAQALKRTGRAQSAVTIAAVAGGIAFIVFFTVFHFYLK